MGTYNINDNIASGDPGHVEQHIAVADAINDLDTRVDGKLSTAIALLSSLAPTDPDILEITVASVIRLWFNEWGALRGRNPYTTIADPLVKSQVEDGDYTAGNAFEVHDNRTGAAATVLWGVNWGTGRITQGDASVGMVYVLTVTQTETDIPTTLPPGTLVVRRTS